MALSKCVECGKDVSTTAEECPNCGNPNPTKTGKQKKEDRRLHWFYNTVSCWWSST